MIDVSDIVSDSDLGGDTVLQLVRIGQVIGANGRAVNTEAAPADFDAVVTMDKAAILERIAEGEYVTGSILLHTTTALRMGGAGVEADVVVWAGARYVVSQLGNYLQAGFNWAVCVPLPLVGAA